MVASCPHENFACQCDVARMSKDIGGPITDYHMDMRLECADCGTPFEFMGLPHGISPDKPMGSPDNKEARMPIRPAGSHGRGFWPGFTITRKT